MWPWPWRISDFHKTMNDQLGKTEFERAIPGTYQVPHCFVFICFLAAMVFVFLFTQISTGEWIGVLIWAAIAAIAFIFRTQYDNNHMRYRICGNVFRVVTERGRESDLWTSEEVRTIAKIDFPRKNFPAYSYLVLSSHPLEYFAEQELSELLRKNPWFCSQPDWKRTAFEHRCRRRIRMWGFWEWEMIVMSYSFNRERTFRKFFANAQWLEFGSGHRE